MNLFTLPDLKKLHKPKQNSSGEENGQVTIIGGSVLFHGAPILSLKVASRIVDMVFFASPDPSVGRVAEKIKSKLFSFIWIPWADVDAYIEKSDAVLIGPGFMRFGSEKRKAKSETRRFEGDGRVSRDITERLLKKFPEKKWVIDAGSLQTMDPEWIPKGVILTPNRKEFELLFGEELKLRGQKLEISLNELIPKLQSLSSKYTCTIVLKCPETIICSPVECLVVKGGNPGLTKGGTGDVLAGLTVALLAKNDPFLAAASAAYLAKAAADELYKKVGTNYNADDLADKIPETLNRLTK